jgi:hypothetical protein
MGLVFDNREIGAKHLALEIRRESLVLMDVGRKYFCELTPDEKASNERTGAHGKSEHIFCYQEGEIEVSKELLHELVKFLDQPGNRAKVFGPYEHLGKRIRASGTCVLD